MNAYQGRALGPGTHTRSPLAVIVSLPCFMATTHSGMMTWRESGLACTGDGSVGSIQWIRWSCQRATGSEEIFSQSVSPTLAFLAESGGSFPSRVALM